MRMNKMPIRALGIEGCIAKAVLVSGGAIDLVYQRPPVKQSVNVIGDDRCCGQRIGEAGDVRRDGDVRMTPIRMICRQGLGAENI